MGGTGLTHLVDETCFGKRMAFAEVEPIDDLSELNRVASNAECAETRLERSGGCGS